MRFGRSNSTIQTRWCFEGWAYLTVVLLVLAGAWVRQLNLLFLVAGLMAGPLLWSWWWAGRQLCGITIRRYLLRSVCAGDLLVVELELVNIRSRGACWGLVVEEQICHETIPQLAASEKIYIPYLPAGRRQMASYQGRLPLRGRYRLGPIRISSRFPFGLVRHSLPLGEVETLMVYPRIGRLGRRWIARRQQAFEGVQRREPRPGRVEGDFYGVRPWQNGDRRRWIHWRVSARHQALVVRQFEQLRNRDLVILLDLGQSGQPPAQEQEAVEKAVSFAATILVQACRQGGNRLGVAIGGQELVWLFGQASTGLLEEAMLHLALVQPGAEDRLLPLVDILADTLQPNTEIVLIRPRASSPPDSHRMDDLRSQLARRLPSCQLLCFDMNDPLLAEYFVPE